MTTQSITLSADKQLDVTIDEYGSGQPFLMLHGGAGPQSVAGFAQKLAVSEHVRVIVPTHPGFGGTNRPDWLNSVPLLAELYVALIDQLDLHHVSVVGSSVGGWIAAEMALSGSNRISHVILINAVGVVVEGQSVADIFQLTMDEIAQLSYHNPAAFRRDPALLTDAEKLVMAGNRQALAVYGGLPSMTDPSLSKRLGAVTVPTLVLWGESDGIVTPDYGRAFSAAIPNAKFQLVSGAGHLPQIETPDQVLTAVHDFVTKQDVTATTPSQRR